MCTWPPSTQALMFTKITKYLPLEPAVYGVLDHTVTHHF